MLDTSNLKKLLRLTASLQLPAIIKKINNQNVFDAMRSDKKNNDDKIMFVLISGIGNMLVDVPVKKRDIYYALEKMKENFLV